MVEKQWDHKHLRDFARISAEQRPECDLHHRPFFKPARKSSLAPTTVRNS
jgi:hypothetical protein